MKNLINPKETFTEASTECLSIMLTAMEMVGVKSKLKCSSVGTYKDVEYKIEINVTANQ